MSPTVKARRRLYGIVGACAALVVVSLGLSAVTFVRQSQADTIRRADRKAQDATTVAQCFQKIERAPDTIRLLEALDISFTNSLLANRQALKDQPSSPLTPTRKASIARLKPAHALVLRYIAQTRREVPKRSECMALAAKFNVDPEPYKPKEKK